LPDHVLRAAGGDAMTAALGLSHHREGRVLVDLEDFEGVGDKEDIHRERLWVASVLLHKT
jgi:hypothetical protein